MMYYFLCGSKGYGEHGPFVHKPTSLLEDLENKHRHISPNYRPSFWIEEREWKKKRNGLLSLTTSNHYNKFNREVRKLPSGRTSLKLKISAKKRFSKI